MRLATLLGATAVLIFSLFTASSHHKEDARTYQIKSYILDNYKSWLAEQEEILGIKHFGEPDIGFSEKPSSPSVDRVYGSYVMSDDKVYFDAELLSLPEDKNEESDARGIGHHEFCHFYMDKLSESMGLGDYPDTDPDAPYRAVTVPTLTLSEGIAHFCWRKVQGNTCDFKETAFERIANEYDIVELRHLAYAAGRCLVEDPINQFGPQAFRYFLENPLKEGDLEDLSQYEKRVLKALK